MPIYAYKCEACGYTKDVLQKVSDAPLQTCPACGAAAFRKQVTAAGFQLKGTGWYVTDFRGGASGAAAGSAAGGDSASSDKASESSTATSQATACGASCACH
jgi:putative FmdB family regulatory protein